MYTRAIEATPSYLNSYELLTTNLQQLRLLYLDVACLWTVQLLKQFDKPNVGDHHFHLLFRSPVSMANDSNHASQFLPDGDTRISTVM